MTSSAEARTNGTSVDDRRSFLLLLLLPQQIEGPHGITSNCLGL